MKFRVKRAYVNFLKFRKSFQEQAFRKFNIVEIVMFWLKSHFTRSQFLVLSGILVGLSGGLAGVILKSVVHKIQVFIDTGLHFNERVWVYAFLPAIGITLTVLIVKLFFKGNDQKGIPLILNDIAKNNSNVSSSKMYSQMIQSAITISFGGSAGLESPIAVTGAAIGSNYSKHYHLDYKERTLLLAAGAAAGIASAFNAPIAGVMFAFELLLVGLVFTDFIPLVIAAICGSLLSKIILNEEVLFSFDARDSFNHVNTHFYIALGILTGLYARYYLLVGGFIRRIFDRFQQRDLGKALVGGMTLSLLCIIFPPLFGEGYSSIRKLHLGDVNHIIHESLFRYFESPPLVIVVFLGLTVMLKAFATGITIHSGGNGGNFAPTLIAGGLLGYWFGYSAELLGFQDVPSTNLMLVGMAGVMSGALYAPLTAIFLIAESSSGYDLFIPLMIVAVISYLINRSFSPINPDLKKLADDGQIFTTRHDQNILSQIELKDCVNNDPLYVSITADGETVLQIFRNTTQNTMAVINEDHRLWGVIRREDLIPYLSGKKPAHQLTVAAIATNPSFKISLNDKVINVIKKLDEADVWQLPVLDSDNRFIGFVSKSEILSQYRLLLRKFSASE